MLEESPLSRNLVKVTGVLASVVLLGGCAAGTHPGAAAQVGKTEISVTDVDETSRAVTGALGQPYTTDATLSTLVNTALVKQITDQRSITVSDADIAQAMTVLPPEGTYDKFVKDPKANAFLHDLAESVVGIIKLGGGTGVKDPNAQQAQQAGQGIVLDASKNIKVDIAPRFGQWKDGAIDGKVSGSLSTLSDQTKASQPADPNAQQPQQDPNQQDPNQPPAEPQG
jgi:hypothetical protein